MFTGIRQLAIQTTETNQVFFYVIPFGLFVIFGVSCISVCFVVRLSASLPIVLSFYSILVVILAASVVHGLVPMFAEYKLQSEKFLCFWNAKQSSSVRTRELKSCRPLGIWAGPFFVIGKKTRTTYLELVLYYTASLVISV